MNILHIHMNRSPSDPNVREVTCHSSESTFQSPWPMLRVKASCCLRTHNPVWCGSLQPVHAEPLCTHRGSSPCMSSCPGWAPGLMSGARPVPYPMAHLPLRLCPPLARTAPPAHHSHSLRLLPATRTHSASCPPLARTAPPARHSHALRLLPATRTHSASARHSHAQRLCPPLARTAPPARHSRAQRLLPATRVHSASAHSGADEASPAGDSLLAAAVLPSCPRHLLGVWAPISSPHSAGVFLLHRSPLPTAVHQSPTAGLCPCCPPRGLSQSTLHLVRSGAPGVAPSTLCLVHQGSARMQPQSLPRGPGAAISPVCELMSATPIPLRSGQMPPCLLQPSRSNFPFVLENA
ncbi:uncharacterized protein LOC116274229 [Papio anubis]|uniref:uncharacterized protein LOC116274229 n=1 Tax=Papio anubis TaxID=9555 RepID=UPI0012AE4CA0|nr:uncharacterized protein LOC116274229 [Papio anubis]